MNKLKRLKVFTLAKFQAMLFALLGVFCGGIYAFGGLAVDSLVSLGMLSSDSMNTPGLSIGTLLAFGALVGMPVLFAIIGYLSGIIEAILYNLVAGWTGGFNIGIE